VLVIAGGPWSCRCHVGGIRPQGPIVMAAPAQPMVINVSESESEGQEGDEVGHLATGVDRGQAPAGDDISGMSIGIAGLYNTPCNATSGSTAIASTAGQQSALDIFTVSGGTRLNLPPDPPRPHPSFPFPPPPPPRLGHSPSVHAHAAHFSLPSSTHINRKTRAVLAAAARTILVRPPLPLPTPTVPPSPSPSA